MIKLYEVRFDLENGSALNVLMAAGSPDEAKSFAADTLRSASEPRADGDALRYCWSYDEITIREIELTEVTAATNRPGDMAAAYAEETGVNYATALVHCNMD